MRRFNRTPCYTGPDDPERGEVRDTLHLGDDSALQLANYEFAEITDAPVRRPKIVLRWLTEVAQRIDWINDVPPPIRTRFLDLPNPCSS